MDQEKINATMEKLSQMKSDAGNFSMEAIEKQTKLFFDTMKVAYKKYITDLSKDADKYKDIKKNVERCQENAKKDNTYGGKIVNVYDLDSSGRVLYKLIQDFCHDATKFFSEDFETADKCEDAAEKFEETVEDAKVNFESHFGMKNEYHITKALSEIYFADKLFSGVIIETNENEKTIIEENIDGAKSIILKQVKSVNYGEVKRAFDDITKTKKSSYQKCVNMIKGLIGTYYRAIIHNIKACDYE